jgi:hypothetical protein
MCFFCQWFCINLGFWCLKDLKLQTYSSGLRRSSTGSEWSVRLKGEKREDDEGSRQKRLIGDSCDLSEETRLKLNSNQSLPKRISHHRSIFLGFWISCPNTWNLNRSIVNFATHSRFSIRILPVPFLLRSFVIFSQASVRNLRLLNLMNGSGKLMLVPMGIFVTRISSLEWLLSESRSCNLNRFKCFFLFFFSSLSLVFRYYYICLICDACFSSISFPSSGSIN